MLRTIQIEGFKTIKKLPPFGLRPINVFIGANGAGKSNLVSFFQMLRSMQKGKLQEYVANWTADALLHCGSKITRDIVCSLTYEYRDNCCVYYTFRLSYGLGGKLLFTEEHTEEQGAGGIPLGMWGRVEPLEEKNDEEGYQPLNTGNNKKVRHVTLGGEESIRLLNIKRLSGVKIQDQLIYELSHCFVHHFNDTSFTARIMQPHYIEDNNELLEDFGNLAAFLYRIKSNNLQDYQRIVQQVRQIAPFFEDFDLQPQKLNPKNIILNWRQHGSDLLFGPHQLSDGMLRAIGLIALLMQPKTDLPRLIVLDEPELGLHPFAIETISAMIRSASKNTQLVIATQSPQLVSEFEPEDIVVVDRQDNVSEFKRLDHKDLEIWLKDYSLGELWQKNVFSGNTNPLEAQHG